MQTSFQRVPRAPSSAQMMLVQVIRNPRSEINYEMPLLYFLESSDTDTRKWSYPSLPLYITQPEREGLQGGMYRDPACSLKLNTEIISEDTSRCISTDTHDMHSRKDKKKKKKEGVGGTSG